MMAYKSASAILAGLIFVAEPAVAADKFDLHCIGTKTSDEKPNGTMDQVLHVDLARAEYCVADCKAVYPIAGVTASEITLRDTHGNRGDNVLMDVARVNRQTGEYSATFIAMLGLPINVTMKAICSAQAFTPFPATKF